KPKHIVAITFTKAASTELAERIQKKALEYLKDEKYKYAWPRLESIDEIFTGTIHSFCDLILGEMPFEANLTPGYEIVEDSAEFHNEVWYEFIRANEDEYKDKIKILSKFNIDYRNLRTNAILAMDNPDVKFTGYPELIDYEDIEKDFQDLKTRYTDLDGSFFKKNSNLVKMLQDILKEGQDLSLYISSILNECPKYEFDPDRLYERFLLKKHLDNPNRNRYKKFISGIYGIYYNLNRLGYNTCTEFVNMAVDYKNENYKNQLTFNELLYKAAELLKNSDTAKKHFKDKYRFFYIDEFQDTDPIQAELILHLTHEGETSSRLKDWHDSRPRPGSLFVVGDPKQSIYRFRRADISIYNQVKKIIEDNGELVYLDINFRSSNNICNWVENTFKNREGFGFKEESTETQAG